MSCGSGPTSTTTALPATPVLSTMPSPCPTSHPTSSQPGGGVQGGRVIGSSDRIGGYPASDPQTPENMAATIYHALGIPATAAWHDESDRPHHIYNGDPITGLM